ncbi:MAG: murJ, partial [Hyphomicrobiales bacterium]|nr:murJ [Hyphomicrobiales bacterium]
MSRRLSSGDTSGALYAQNRTMALTIALSAPFFVAFTLMPDLIMRGVFLHGRFTEEAAQASARVLCAYGFGLFAIVLIRSAVASFQSRGDTRTPMLISLTAVGINVLLKLALFTPFGAAGLASATAAGAWINFGLLTILAIRAGAMKPDSLLGRVTLATTIASCLLAAIAIFGMTPAARLASLFGRFEVEAQLALIGTAGALAYGMALFAILHALGVRPARLKPLPRRVVESPPDL